MKTMELIDREDVNSAIDAVERTVRDKASCGTPFAISNVAVLNACKFLRDAVSHMPCTREEGDIQELRLKAGLYDRAREKARRMMAGESVAAPAGTTGSAMLVPFVKD